MELQVMSYPDLFDKAPHTTIDKMKTALFATGIIGIQGIPNFIEKSKSYINAARAFSALADDTKRQYTPLRDSDEMEGYELGAEWFQDNNGHWQIDDKKASFYARIPNQQQNKWPREVDLKTPYLELGELIFKVGKHILDAIGLTDVTGIQHDKLAGLGRMLHYHKEKETFDTNPNWCGAHYDHGVFTGLLPAYYFRDGKEVEEPEEAGLFIWPTNGSQFEKIDATDKSVLLFQVGEFGQLASNDHIRATKHLVKKAKGNIERFTLAVFFNAADEEIIYPQSELTKDARYFANRSPNGGIRYKQWHEASLARYLAQADDK